MQYELNSDIKNIMDVVIEEGYSCYLVGGAVRDFVLGVDVKDFDLCTDMPLNKLKERLSEMVIMKENSHRNTGIIRKGEYDYEISSFKGESLEEDLSNRDFRMNAMAIDRNGNLIDPFDGISDILEKKISLIKSDGFAFDVDPLRILRAIRQAYKFGFSIDNNCLKQMNIKKDLLDGVAPERIYEEFKKILLFDNVSEILLSHKNILFKIVPELEKCDGFIQNSDYHVYDVFGHILKVVENTSSNLSLRLAALFHDVGKPDRYTIDEDGVGHFYGHPSVSADIFRKFANKYKVDNKTKSTVYKLILEHENQFSGKPNKIYGFYKRFGYDDIELLFELKRADALGQNPKYLDRLVVYDELLPQYLSVRDTLKNIDISGRELVNIGIEGRRIKEVLDIVNSAVVCGQVENDNSKILRYVKSKFLSK